jgi:hypothetical protein
VLKRIWNSPSYANVISSIALFAALGTGGAYAANTIGSSDIIDESILSQDVKDGEVKTSDIKNSAITSLKINNGSVLNSEIANNAVDAAKIKDGTVLPADQGTVPAVNTVYTGLSAEIANSGQNKILHPDFDIYDTANIHDADAASANLVAPVNGMYVVSAMVDWDANGTGYRRSTITGPSGSVASVAGPALPSPGITSQNPVGIERMAAGQAVRVEVLQGSGGDLGVRLTRFQMTYVGGY